jgi:hypothetical protein
MEDVEQARDRLRGFESGSYKVVDDGGGKYFSKITGETQEKQRKVMIKLQNCIESHERGNRVYEPKLDMSDSCRDDESDDDKAVSDCSVM